MGVWSSIEGTISPREEQHFSVRKFTKDFFDGEDFVVKYDNETKEFSLVCELDGQYANEVFIAFMQQLQLHKIKFDLNVTVRWVG